jgi:arsenate reductase-like glutaredoxin family protein
VPDQNLNDTSVATPEAAVLPEDQQSAADYLKGALGELGVNEASDIPAEAQTEPESKLGEVKADTEVAPEAEEFDEEVFLKKEGFSEKSLGEVKTNLNRAMNQSQIYNWAKNHIPGLDKFILNQMDIARGLPGENMTVEQLQPKAERAVAEDDFLGQFKPEEVELVEKVLTKLLDRQGIVRKQDLDAEKKQTEVRQAYAQMGKNIEDFKKARTDDLKTLGMDWQNDVEPKLFEIIEQSYGITNPALVTPERLAIAYREMVWQKQGGQETLIANAEKAATDKIKAKKALRPIPTPGTKGVETLNLSDVENWPKEKLAEFLRKYGG